jgi:hypothetical protein
LMGRGRIGLRAGSVALDAVNGVDAVNAIDAVNAAAAPTSASEPTDCDSFEGVSQPGWGIASRACTAKPATSTRLPRRFMDCERVAACQRDQSFARPRSLAAVD